MKLILQSPTLRRSDLDERFANLDEIAPHAYALRHSEKNSEIAEWCEQRRIDCAWVPEGRRFADLKLLAMDMDSTLITIECIDEIGEFAGKKAEIAAITEQAMRGELDYPASLRRRVLLLSGLTEESLLRVYEDRLKLTPGAEELIAACKTHGVKVLLVSGGFTFFTERLKERLGLDYTISNVLEVKGRRLTGALVGEIVDAEAKARKFVQVRQDLGCAKEQTVAIGDGANDLKMMKQAGLSVAFRAKPVVRAQADCALTWSGLDGVLNLFDR